jgi:hypothetical protein
MQLDSISVHLFTKNGWNMDIYYIITDIDECVKGSSRCDSQAVCRSLHGKKIRSNTRNVCLTLQ